MFWRLEALGGPYDGTRNLGLDEAAPVDLPQEIFIGRCYSEWHCGQPTLTHPHAFYWVDDPPPDAVPYRFGDAEVMAQRGEEFPIARYIFGQVDLDGVADRELAGVGSGHA